MTVLVRPAVKSDASGMCAVINPLIKAGGTTAHRTLFTNHRMIAHYLAPKRCVSCVVAEDAGEIIGFQAIEWADPDWQGDGKLPNDWAVIASFVSTGAQGRGAGSAMFNATKDAARRAGVTAIDATIRSYNMPGLTYYTAMGFVDYCEGSETVSKKFVL